MCANKDTMERSRATVTVRGRRDTEPPSCFVSAHRTGRALCNRASHGQKLNLFFL